MADVRSKTGAAILSDFSGSVGTPIVVNQTTGDLAVLKTGDTIFIVSSDKALLAGSSSQTFQVAPATTGTMAPQASQLYETSILVNETFLVNNGNAGTPYVSGAALAAGQYGHEMWKAGASGGDYTFTQNAATTQITIATGKTLIQVVENAKVASTTYVLSWTGTAQARYAVNSVTPAGSFASSPIYITGQTIGTTMSIEFNTGTLFEPALIEGALPLKAARKNSDQVIIESQRYYEVGNIRFDSLVTTANNYSVPVSYKVTKRSSPTVVVTNVSVVNFNAATNTLSNNVDGFSVYHASTASAAANFVDTWISAARL